MSKMGDWIYSGLVCFMLISYISCRHLYISHDGKDEASLIECTILNPCRTLQYAVSASQHGDSINIKGDEKTYKLDKITNLNKSLKFTSYEGTPSLTCEPNSGCHFQFHNQTLTFDDLFINYCGICAEDAYVNINTCILDRSSVILESKVSSLNTQGDLSSTELKNTELLVIGKQEETFSDAKVYVNMDSVVMYGLLSNFKTFSNKSELSTITQLNVVMENVTFHSMDTQISIQDNTILNFSAENMQVYNMTTDNHCFAIDAGTISEAFISIRNSRFSRNLCVNGGALYFTSSVASTKLEMENTIFDDNVGFRAGSAVRLDMLVLSPTRTVNIKRCSFFRNLNTESAAALYINGGIVNITDTTFYENIVETGSGISIATDSVDQQGSGGAVYVKASARTVFDNCVFINNTASWYGGAMAAKGDVNITNSYFENVVPFNLNQIPLGYMLYMSGDTGMGNVIFNVSKSFQNVPALMYSSQAKLLYDIGGNISFTCPVGSQFSNSSLAIESNNQTKYRSLYYTCNPCSDGKYSLQRGYRDAPLGDEYPNWSEDFQCRLCEYGATCFEGTIKARVNFWGYVQNGSQPPRVNLIPCLDGYCCQDEVCDTYDECHQGRVGTLCGHCQAGTAEMLFLTDCIPSQKCDDSWYMAIDAATALLSVLFFLYQIEIGMFVVKHILGFNVNIGSQRDESSIQAYYKSIFYFYQTVALLTVQKNQASTQIGIELQPLFSAILSFEPISALFGICPFPTLNPVIKTILNAVPTLFIFCWMGIIAVFVKFYSSSYNKEAPVENLDISSHSSSNSSSGCEDVHAPEPEVSQYVRPNLKSRLAIACVQIFLLNYMTISSMTFALLACVDINGKDVLYIDGNVTCISPWQSVFIIIAIVHVVPLFMAVIVSRYLLETGHIGLGQFYACYFAPFPMLCYWGCVWLWKYFKVHKHIDTSDPNRETEVIIYKTDFKLDLHREDHRIIKQILLLIEEPYRKKGAHAAQESVLYWEGILIFRRLVLSLMEAFALSPLLQITLQSLTCLVFLIWHIIVRPFSTPKANKLETLSLTTLTMVAVVHVIQATFFSAGKIPEGPAQTQIYVTDWIEWILINLLPFIIALALIITICLRFIGLIFKAGKCIFIICTDLCSRPCRKDKSTYDTF